MKKVISLVLALAVCLTMVSVVSAKADPDIDFDIPTVEGYAGNDVEVNINITANKGFSALGLKFNWDASKLTLKGVKNKLNDLPEGYVNAALDTDIETANDKTSLYIGWAPAATGSQEIPANITYTGTIVTLVFTVSEDMEIGDNTVVSLKVDSCFDRELNDLAYDSTAEGEIDIVEKTFTTGDLDGNGVVTDADAVYLLMYTFFPDDYPLNQPGDFDGNGVVTDADAVYILMYTFFPVDYPLSTWN